MKCALPDDAERSILTWAVSKPSTDEQTTQLAEGKIDTFAAWYVETRSKNEILLCDFRDRMSGRPSMGWAFGALAGFHKIYSVALLYFAKSLLIAKASVD